MAKYPYDTMIGHRSEIEKPKVSSDQKTNHVAVFPIADLALDMPLLFHETRFFALEIAFEALNFN
jgi:hypothetical protein